ncbi:helix-turn-helix domain-containing protein [Metabacillus sp. RGM 3146]|uniref:helix-turn-helix domain-containing protein n=1 Tax=Metabacillus sp. RGM 3146 TaxID=3401092 RepID=UPI003B9CFFC2
MLDRSLLSEMENFILHHQFITLQAPNYKESEESLIYSEPLFIELEEFIEDKRKPALNQILLELLRRKGIEDEAEIYKKAGIDRRHYSKIKNNQVQPRKQTLIALGLALELNTEELEDLLKYAGHSMSYSDTGDLIIYFCLEKKLYDIDKVNEALDYFCERPLIG